MVSLITYYMKYPRREESDTFDDVKHCDASYSILEFKQLRACAHDDCTTHTVSDELHWE